MVADDHPIHHGMDVVPPFWRRLLFNGQHGNVLLMMKQCLHEPLCINGQVAKEADTVVVKQVHEQRVCAVRWNQPGAMVPVLGKQAPVYLICHRVSNSRFEGHAVERANRIIHATIMNRKGFSFGHDLDTFDGRFGMT